LFRDDSAHGKLCVTRGGAGKGKFSAEKFNEIIAVIKFRPAAVFLVVFFAQLFLVGVDGAIACLAFGAAKAIFK
jgi:hypothetical protein